MSNVVEIKGAREAPKSERSSMQTLLLTVDQVGKWLVPPFQRPLRINSKLQALTEEIRRDGCSIPGILTLGTLKASTTLYIVDGQHRVEAYKMSGLAEVIADVRIVHFNSMAEMSDEFVMLNSALVRMRPDDILRGLELTSPAMRRIRAECPFVGYDNIRRSSNTSPIVSMAMLIKCWSASAAETPTNHLSGRTAATVVGEMDENSTDQIIRFLHLAHAAWGRDPEYFRLWSTLNFTLCMWLWRRLVLDKTRGIKRFVVLSDAQFRQCLMSLSADAKYLEWLQGRVMSDRDRSPALGHIRRIFAKRLLVEGNPRPLLPQPAWHTK